jgi:hypothetical protein
VVGLRRPAFGYSLGRAWGDGPGGGVDVQLGVAVAIAGAVALAADVALPAEERSDLLAWQ